MLSETPQFILALMAIHLSKEVELWYDNLNLYSIIYIIIFQTTCKYTTCLVIPPGFISGWPSETNVAKSLISFYFNILSHLCSWQLWFPINVNFIGQRIQRKTGVSNLTWFSLKVDWSIRGFSWPKILVSFVVYFL